MTSKIEGISAETVEAMAKAVATSERGPMHIAMERDFSLVRIAIIALLASGEVVLKSDVAEILDHVARAHAALHNCEKSEMLDYAHEEIHKVFEIEKRIK